jgi:hypothetical protein
VLAEGLGETLGSVRESEHSTEFLIAEESAKRGKKNVKEFSLKIHHHLDLERL